jgi:hypothetical protein
LKITDRRYQIGMILLFGKAALIQRITRQSNTGMQMHLLVLISDPDFIGILEDMTFIGTKPAPHLSGFMIAQRIQEISFRKEFIGGFFHV